MVSGFNLRESLAEVKSLMEGGVAPWEERCVGMHRHYQALVRDYKRTEKKLTECQKKQLEVCTLGVGVVSTCVCMHAYYMTLTYPNPFTRTSDYPSPSKS